MRYLTYPIRWMESEVEVTTMVVIIISASYISFESHLLSQSSIALVSKDTLLLGYVLVCRIIPSTNPSSSLFHTVATCTRVCAKLLRRILELVECSICWGLGI